jgi:hypothetical protein
MEFLTLKLLGNTNLVLFLLEETQFLMVREE